MSEIITSVNDASLSNLSPDNINDIINSSDFSSLTPDEQRALVLLLDELQQGQITLENITALDYIQPPVDIDTFLNDGYYLGSFMRNKVYDYWVKALHKLFPTPFTSPYMEVCVTGSIGTGKSTFALIALAYDLYKLLLLRDPHAQFGLIKSTAIVMAFFNITMSLAQDVGWAQLQDFVTNSPFFRVRMELAEKLRKQGIEKSIFPNNIGVVVGSRASHTLGKAVFSAFLDEANFTRTTSQIADNYNSVRIRMKSRFEQSGGSLPGHLYLVSSRNDSASFLEKHIAEVARNDPTTLILAPALWDVKSKAYCGKKFIVFKGSDTIEPMILDDPEFYKNDPEIYYNTIEVPIEHYDDFAKDIKMSLRDLAGVATFSSSKWFGSITQITKAQTIEQRIPDSIVLKFDDDRTLYDIVKSQLMLPELLQFRNYPHAIHMDTGLSGDRFGFALGFVESLQQIKRHNAVTLEWSSVALPRMVIDLAFAIQAYPGQQIPFYKVRELVVNLRDFGFNIFSVTTDGFQSADMRQMLTIFGFNTAYLSMDKTIAPYVSFKNSIAERRLILPKNEILLQEMRDLEHISSNKIDHPIGGSKDLSDAVCGVVHTLNTTPEMSTRLPILTTIDDDILSQVVATRDTSLLERPKSQFFDDEEVAEASGGEPDLVNPFGPSFDKDNNVSSVLDMIINSNRGSGRNHSIWSPLDGY